ncbi:hypothetical protein NORO109296_01870 [Nocardiopsis rhodophaea]
MNLHLSGIPRGVALRAAALVRGVAGAGPRPEVPQGVRRALGAGPAVAAVAATVWCTGFTTPDLDSGTSLMGANRYHPDAYGYPPWPDWGGVLPGWPPGTAPHSRDGRPTGRVPAPVEPTRQPGPVPRPRPDPAPGPPSVPRPRPEPRPGLPESASDSVPGLGGAPGAVPPPGQAIDGPRIPVVGGSGGGAGSPGHEAETTRPSRGSSASPPSGGEKQPDAQPSPSRSPSAAEATGVPAAAAEPGERGTSTATKERGVVGFGHAPADSALSAATGAVGTAATWCLALLLGVTVALRLSIGWPRFTPSYRGRRRSDT